MYSPSLRGLFVRCPSQSISIAKKKKKKNNHDDDAITTTTTTTTTTTNNNNNNNNNISFKLLLGILITLMILQLYLYCSVNIELVPELPTEGFQLDTKDAGKIISKKKNWSATGPDSITNFWWKKAHVLHEGVARSFQATVHQPEFPLWFTAGKTNLIRRPGEPKSETNMPITCLNRQYKWYTSCLLGQANRHVKEHGLVQGDQRGAKEGHH